MSPGSACRRPGRWPLSATTIFVNFFAVCRVAEALLEEVEPGKEMLLEVAFMLLMEPPGSCYRCRTLRVGGPTRVHVLRMSLRDILHLPFHFRNTSGNGVEADSDLVVSGLDGPAAIAWTPGSNLRFRKPLPLTSASCRQLLLELIANAAYQPQVRS